MSLKLVLLVGSVRSDRQGIKAARFVERSLTARGHEVTLVDPVEARLPLLDRCTRNTKGEPLVVAIRVARPCDAAARSRKRASALVLG